MMRKRAKWILCFALSTVVLLALFAALRSDRNACRRPSEAEYASLLSEQSERGPDGYSGELLILNEPAPYDAASETYYVPQSRNCDEWQLPIRWSDPRYTMIFAPDALFADRAEAIRTGHAFLLLVSDGRTYFTKRVVFTGMPMMTVSKRNRMLTDTDRYLLRTFEPEGGEGGTYRVQEAYVTYRLRGGSSRAWKKPSYRAYLTNVSGKPVHRPLFGLRADDDWILTPMYLDPQKMRDPLCCALWNTLCETECGAESEPYSHTEIVELVLLDEYFGMFAVMEPVDQKSVGLNLKTDYLFTMDQNVVTSAAAPEEVVITDLIEEVGHFPNLPSDPELASAAYSSMLDYVYMFFTGGREIPPEVLEERYSVSNLINISLFADATANADFDEKNAYIRGTLRPDGTYAYTTIPWDCDLTFGAKLSGVTFDSYELRNRWRTELKVIERAYPELVRPILRERWAQLRQTIFSDAALEAMMREIVEGNVASGALARDAQRWPESENSADLAPVLDYMRRQLAVLDEQYGNLT